MENSIWLPKAWCNLSFSLEQAILLKGNNRELYSFKFEKSLLKKDKHQPWTPEKVGISLYLVYYWKDTGLLVDLDGSHVSFKTDDLSNQFTVTDTHL